MSISWLLGSVRAYDEQRPPKAHENGEMPRREADENSMRTAAAGGGRLADRLRRASIAGFVGRERELERLLDEGAVVTFVHGMGGIGKSALLDAAAERMRRRGDLVVRLDGREIEPTARGFLAALGVAAAGTRFTDLEHAAQGLGVGPTAVVVDDYDRLRLVYGWLRQTLLPALPERVRCVIASRFAPSSAWTSSPGWSEATAVLRLGPLDDADARALLARRGVEADAMPPLLALARGNPLALELAARGTDPHAVAGSFDAAAVLDVLARRCIDESTDARVRAAIEAACVVRCATRPLLAAMLGADHGDHDDMAALADLPFIERTGEGLLVSEVVRNAVLGRLAALDPERLATLRAAAWRVLESTLGTAQADRHAWRLTADVLFLVEQPEVREAFFPSATLSVAVENALSVDEAAVMAIAREREPPALQEILATWWIAARSSFRVARDGTGEVVGFGIFSDADAVPPALRAADPLVRAWLDHLAAGPGRSRGALFARALVCSAAAPDDARAALWIDAKRAYIDRPTQWAVYMRAREPIALLPTVERFGFQLAEPHAGEGDAREHTLLLHFGEDGIWTWLRRLVGAGAAGPASHAPSRPQPPWWLDVAARALRVDGAEVALSPLELGVLAHLLDAGGSVVTREELLDAVWKQRFTGSNVVDAVIRLLRKKLGHHAEALETVKGHGYRLIAPTA
jgi:hypothetical protein